MMRNEALLNPRVSVLMCVANAERYVAASIESVLQQTFSDFEFLIVENGSDDRTWEIISSFSDKRIRAFRTKLRQLPFNLNYGINEAKAPLIARMDADDIAAPKRLEEQVAYMDANPQVGVLGSWFEVFGEGIETRIVEVPTSDKEIRARLPYRFVLCHPSTMLRTDVLASMRGYEHTRYCEDLDLWLRIARDRSIKFANLGRPLLRYRVHKTQAKGSREAYFSTISILVKEGLMQRSGGMLLGAVWTYVKYIVFGVIGYDKKTRFLGFKRKGVF